MRRRRNPVFSSRLFWCVLLCTLPLGCGDDGRSTTASCSGQCTLQVGGVGMPIDMGQPTWGFEFATQDVLVGTVGQPLGDIYFLEVELSPPADLYLHATEGDGVLDAGVAELDSVSEAPETGYSASIKFTPEVSQDWSLLIGRAFCVRTMDGAHYAKMRIVDADDSARTITFDWVYLPEGGRVFP